VAPVFVFRADLEVVEQQGPLTVFGPIVVALERRDDVATLEGQDRLELECVSVHKASGVIGPLQSFGASPPAS
jgi:hypothetical protein